jgi:putative transposase
MIAKTHGAICIEDLAVKNLVKNHHLARSISDAAWGELGRQLRYKSD